MILMTYSLKYDPTVVQVPTLTSALNSWNLMVLWMAVMRPIKAKTAKTAITPEQHFG